MKELGPSISESVAECWTLASRLQDGLPRMTAADLTASLAGHPFQVQDQVHSLRELFHVCSLCFSALHLIDILHIQSRLRRVHPQASTI
jgi:hypothetical protein